MTPEDQAAADLAVAAAKPLNPDQISLLRSLLAPTLRRATTRPAGTTRPTTRRRAA